MLSEFPCIRNLSSLNDLDSLISLKKYWAWCFDQPWHQNDLSWSLNAEWIIKAADLVIFWWNEAVEVIEATEVGEAVEVIEAAEVPDAREITQYVKCRLFWIFRGQRGCWGHWGQCCYQFCWGHWGYWGHWGNSSHYIIDFKNLSGFEHLSGLNDLNRPVIITGLNDLNSLFGL